MSEQNAPVPGELNQGPVDNNVGSANAPGTGELVPMLQRPDWVPEKFYKDGHVNFRELAKSYGELEKQRGQTPPPPQSDSKQQDGNQTPPPQAPVVPGVAPDAMQKYSAEITKSGALSEGSYAELAKLGYGKAVVDAYVRGLTPQTDVQAVEAAAVERAKFVDETINKIGGKEVLSDMTAWAAQNLSAADLKVYNEAVDSNDTARVKQAVNGLYHLYSQENGVEGKALSGSRPSSPGGITPFASNEEVVAAMQNPRYERDPAYRAEVERRLMHSNVFAQSRDVKDPSKQFTRYQS